MKVQKVRDVVDHAGVVNADALRDDIDELREGTRDQYESGWEFIEADATAGVDEPSVVFDHQLGEIPWVCSVIASQQEQGGDPIETSDLTVLTTETTITVKNTSTLTSYYVKVRAM